MVDNIKVGRPFPGSNGRVDEVVSVWPLQAQLGEGPVWSEAERSFYFVDILRYALCRYRPEDGDTRIWNVPKRPTFLIPTHDGDLFCGMEDGLYLFDQTDEELRPIMPVEKEQARTRLNDGHIDQKGRLWFGTMDDKEELPLGSLYSLEDSLALRQHHGGYTISNGPVMSQDGRTLYHCESAQGVIYAFNVLMDGTLGERRLFARIDDGAPDGLAMDSQGTVWVGVWGGYRLERFRPDGARLEPVHIPAANVTKAAFGGDDLRTLFVTTARKGLSDEELEKEPLNGAVFCLRVDVPGLPQGLMMLPE
mgnify:CR=1 FL=1